MEPGAEVRLSVICKPGAEGPAFESAIARVVARLHAFGAPGICLSGVSLSSGTGVQELKASRLAETHGLPSFLPSPSRLLCFIGSLGKCPNP